jgi:hypothetical protein
MLVDECRGGSFVLLPARDEGIRRKGIVGGHPISIEIALSSGDASHNCEKVIGSLSVGRSFRD